eukprot:COSAG01_NODE_23_length_37704_cov_30.005877_4_plen_81_part_00
MIPPMPGPGTDTYVCHAQNKAAVTEIYLRSPPIYHGSYYDLLHAPTDPARPAPRGGGADCRGGGCVTPPRQRTNINIATK